MNTNPDTQGLRLCRSLAHVTFQRLSGFRLLEDTPGWARRSAEGALIIPLSLNGYLVTGAAFIRGSGAGDYGHIQVILRITEYPDPGEAGIDISISRFIMGG